MKTFTLIKGNLEKLEGKVLIYLDTPSNNKSYTAIFAATNLSNFLEIYSQYLKNTGTDISELESMLDQTQKIDSQNDKKIILAQVPIQDIENLEKQYDCDILKLDSTLPQCIPQQMAHEYHLHLLERHVDFYFKNYYSQKLEKNQVTYANCSRETWKKHFSELHAHLLKPELGKTYDAIENEIKKICENSPIPETIISNMMHAARREQNNKRKKLILNLYKDLIFALEEQNYEMAAKIRDEIKKYKT